VTLPGQMLTLAEFCERLRISLKTGRRLVAARRIGYFRIEGSIRIAPEEVSCYLTTCHVPPRALIQPAKSVTATEIIEKARQGRPRVRGNAA